MEADEANRDDLTVHWATQPRRKWPKSASAKVKEYMMENQYFNVTASTGNHEEALQKLLMETLAHWTSEEEKKTIADAIKKKLVSKVQNTRLQLIQKDIIAVVGDKTYILEGRTQEERLTHKADLWIDACNKDVPFDCLVTAMCRRLPAEKLFELARRQLDEDVARFDA